MDIKISHLLFELDWPEETLKVSSLKATNSIIVVIKNDIGHELIHQKNKV